ncbi:MAG: P-II family nitrogen regulator [Methanophagales archaeon]|nr:P-II family nitrogen regulator [Methanophagales archaeon]
MQRQNAATEFQLIIAIVEAGRASATMDAARSVGAEGCTILYGRGVGVHEHDTFFGASIEPEKEILMILIAKANTDMVLEAVVSAGELNEPGRGIAFVTDVVKIAGIVHIGE